MMHQTVIVKKFFQHQKNLEAKCVYSTHSNLISLHYSLHVTTRWCCA